jgi:hypothetical protein
MFDPGEVIADLESKRNNLDAAISALRALYGIPATPASATGKVAAVRVARFTPRCKPGSPPPEAPEHTGRPSPVQDAILQVISPDVPMTSLEILERLQERGVKTTAGSVYAMVRTLLDKGLIARSKNDEGRVAWTLVVK